MSTTEPPAAGPNVDLMQQVLDHITAHPEEHDQDRWGVKTDCGTAACFAGWTRIFVEDDPWTDNDGEGYLQHATGDVAQQHLGLTDEQAAVLFHDAGDLREVWHVCAEIAGGAVTVPADLADAEVARWAADRLEWMEDNG